MEAHTLATMQCHDTISYFPNISESPEELEFHHIRRWTMFVA